MFPIGPKQGHNVCSTPEYGRMGTTKNTKNTGKGKWTSRAVQRDIEPGSMVDCKACGEQVKFQAKVRLRQIICNVYIGGKWKRVEHYHAECYQSAGEPYGAADATPVMKHRGRVVASA